MTLPLLIEPDELEPLLGSPGLVIVDLCKPDIYQQAHIPSAVHLDYSRIVSARMPVVGLLPDGEQLGQTLGSLGITPQSHVVAYDDEGGGKACRLLWTLAAIGHEKMSYINGGLHAWANEGHKLEKTPVTAQPAQYTVTFGINAIATHDYILKHLEDPQVVLLDARTVNEFHGTDKRAELAGHIPGAINLDWVMALDQQHNLRLKQTSELENLFHHLGITPDKEIIAYCHSHHRSSLLWFALKHLGYDKVRGYPGSWSDWGNRADSPVEQ